jgi:serine/threonine protein kinase/class 3 adenylate cyclase
MNPAVAGPELARVEEFQRKHRLALLTLVFTDVVGSTQLKQEHDDTRAVDLIQRHHAVVREGLVQFPQAEEIETAGDSFLLVFARPSDAVRFSLLVQSRLRTLAEQSGARVFDRIGIHVGEVFVQEQADSTKLFGSQVDLCARVMSLGAANQILMTRFVFDNARQMLRGNDLPGGGPLRWLNHGLYQFKGIEEPTEVCEVRVDLDGTVTPPGNSDKAHRYALTEGEPVLGWRPALDEVVPGTKWTLEKKLGEGGFGEVWLGRHETLKERRVFKFCFRAERVRSLKREVTLFRVMKEKIGAHPNIVGIQEVFFDQPPFYIVMDYAEGQDLRAWCETQGAVHNIPLTTRLEIVAQVADALQAAHEAGVIHRDVKPSNILVSDGKPDPQAARPEVKLTDFGIGQVVSQEALAGMTRMGFTQTMVGPGSSSQTGTQLYMAPELIAGQAASVGSDIYSLGVVLYQLLIGDFGRPVTTDWARRVSDPLLREDLEKCFAGDAAERFANARELARSVRSMEPRRANALAQLRSARRWKLALRLVVLVALVAAVALFIRHQRSTVLGGTRNLQALYYFDLGQNDLRGAKNSDLVKDALKKFDQAIGYDTNYALAYVGKATACLSLDKIFEPGAGWDKTAFEAADKAIELCPELATAYVTRGGLWFTPLRRWDVERNIQDIRRALSLDRRVKGAHLNLAFLFCHLGLLDEAVSEVEKEFKLYPEDPAALQAKGLILINQGKFQQTLDVLANIPEEAYPHPRFVGWLMGLAYFYEGKTDKAAALMQELLSRKDLTDDPLLASVQAIFYAASNNVAAAEEQIQKAKKADERFIHYHHITYDIGSAYALLGRPDEATRWLRKSVEDGFPCYPFLTIDPNLRKLRDDAGFRKLLAALHAKYEQTKGNVATWLR